MQSPARPRPWLASHQHRPLHPQAGAEVWGRDGAPTWWHPGGDGGGRHGALALGRHGSHLDGVGGKRSEAGDTVVQGDIGEVVGDTRVGSVILLPRDTVPWGLGVVSAEVLCSLGGAPQVCDKDQPSCNEALSGS